MSRKVTLEEQSSPTFLYPKIELKGTVSLVASGERNVLEFAFGVGNVLPGVSVGSAKRES